MLRGISWIGGGSGDRFFSVLRPSSGNGIGMFCVCAGIFSFFQRTSFFAVRAVGGRVEIVFRCAGSETCRVGFSMCIQWSVNENRVLPGDRLLEGDVGHLFLGRHSRYGLGSGLGRTKRLALAG